MGEKTCLTLVYFIFDSLTYKVRESKMYMSKMAQTFFYTHFNHMYNKRDKNENRSFSL